MVVAAAPSRWTPRDATRASRPTRACCRGREGAGLRWRDGAVVGGDEGLAGKARGILVGSDISAFGAAGMALELELLVRTGRAEEVRDWTAPEQEEAIGPVYQWLRLQAF